MSKMESMIIAVIVVCVAFPLGCFNLGGTQEKTKFYILTASPNPEMLQAAAPPEAPSDCIAIGIARVDIPDYLNRPQIVTRVSPTQIETSEFHRWAEPLAANFGRVLADNLSKYTCAETVVFPHIRGNNSSFRVKVEVLRFDGSLGNDVELKVRWSLFDRNEAKPSVTKQSSYTAKTDSASYEDLVCAMCLTVDAFGKEVFDAVARLRKASL